MDNTSSAIKWDSHTQITSSLLLLTTNSLNLLPTPLPHPAMFQHPILINHLPSMEEQGVGAEGGDRDSAAGEEVEEAHPRLPSVLAAKGSDLKMDLEEWGMLEMSDLHLEQQVG